MTRLSAATYAKLYYASASDTSAAEWPALTKRFLALLRRQRSMKLLPRILMHLQQLDDAHHQRTRISVSAATDELTAHLQSRLASFFGHVILDVKVDPAVRGGLVLRVGDREIDASLRSRLFQLRHYLTQPTS